MGSVKVDRRKDNLVRLPIFVQHPGLSRTTIYQRMAAGRFPRFTPIGDEQRRWDEGSPA